MKFGERNFGTKHSRCRWPGQNTQPDYPFSPGQFLHRPAVVFLRRKLCSAQKAGSCRITQSAGSEVQGDSNTPDSATDRQVMHVEIVRQKGPTRKRLGFSY